MEKYPLVVHPKQHGSFASANPGMEPCQMDELEGLLQVFWLNHCFRAAMEQN
jgi:hypothetical protein